MLTFTNEIIRDLLSKSLETATIVDGRWQDAGSGSGSNVAEYIEWLTIRDLSQSVTADVSRIRAHPLVPDNIPVYGYIYSVTTGALTEVPEAMKAGDTASVAATSR
jgi:carbonic anhydrase